MAVVVDPSRMMTNAEWRAASGNVTDPDKLTERADSVLLSTNREAVLVNLEYDARKALEAYEVKGVSLARPDAFERLMEDAAEKHDAEVSGRLLELDRDLAATETDAATRLETSRRVVEDSDQVRRDTRELVLYRRWEGRTLTELAKAYEQTTDAADPTFVRMVEDEPELSRLLRLKADGHDATAIQKIQAARKARKAAREDAGARKALEKIKELRSATSLATFIALARRGELRIARKPQGR